MSVLHHSLGPFRAKVREELSLDAMCTMAFARRPRKAILWRPDKGAFYTVPFKTFEPATDVEPQRVGSGSTGA